MAAEFIDAPFYDPTEYNRCRCVIALRNEPSVECSITYQYDDTVDMGFWYLCDAGTERAAGVARYSCKSDRLECGGSVAGEYIEETACKDESRHRNEGSPEATTWLLCDMGLSSSGRYSCVSETGTSPCGSGFGASRYYYEDSCRSKLAKMRVEMESCKVTNFQLPQTFTDFDVWIATAGDPQFLVYFQSFPDGEDDQWRSHSEWFKTVGKVMFAAFCVGHFLKPLKYLWSGGKTVISAARTPVSTMNRIRRAMGEVGGLSEMPTYIVNAGRRGLAKLTGKTMSNRVIFDDYMARNGDDVARAARNFLEDNGITGAGEGLTIAADFQRMSRGEIAETYLASKMKKESVGDMIKSIFNIRGETVAENILSAANNAIVNPRFVAYTGIDTLASYYLARMDSEFGKFTDIYENSLVVQKSMSLTGLRNAIGLGSRIISRPASISDPRKERLVDVMMPVTLKKPEFFNDPEPFYIVSPCRSDLVVKKENVTCGVYSYDSNTGSVMCDSPETQGFFSTAAGIPQCGSFLYFQLASETPLFISNEVELIQNMNVEVFPSTVQTIDNSDLVCCRSSSGPEYNDWLSLEMCSLIENGINTSDSECTQPKPSSVRRKSFKDPINGIDFYYSASTGVVDYYKFDWDCVPDVNKYAEIEYDSGSGPTVWYIFDTASSTWQYKIPSIDDKENYVAVSDVTNDVMFSSDGVDSNPHREMINDMIGKNFAEGVSLIENNVNQLDNDRLKIHYPNSFFIETKEIGEESDKIFGLFNLVNLCDSKIQKIPKKKDISFYSTTETTTTGHTIPSITSSPVVTCLKYTLTENTLGSDGVQFGGVDDISKGLGEEGKDVFSCHIDSLRNLTKMKTSASKDFYDADIDVFFSVGDDGSVGTPQSIEITEQMREIMGTGRASAIMTNDFSIVIHDTNNDRLADQVSHYYSGWTGASVGGIVNNNQVTFSDDDYDGDPDSIYAIPCRTTGITIEPDMDPYNGKGITQYNYCYKKSYTTTLGLVGTVGAFGISALCKTAKIGGPLAWVLTTAVDCGIAYAEYRWAEPEWPGDENP